MDSGLKYDWFWGHSMWRCPNWGDVFSYWIESTGEPKVMRRSTLRSLQNLAADVNVGEEWGYFQAIGLPDARMMLFEQNINTYII